MSGGRQYASTSRRSAGKEKSEISFLSDIFLKKKYFANDYQTRTFLDEASQHFSHRH